MRVGLNRIKEMIPMAQRRLTGDHWLDAWSTVGPFAYWRMFYYLAKELEPNLVVELGAYQGLGAAHFYAGYPGEVITIDIGNPSPGIQETLSDVLSRYGIQYIQGDSCSPDVVSMVERYAPIDILFLDSDHKYPRVKKEESAYFPLLADEALLIYHDIFDAVGYTENMVRAWNEVPYEKFLTPDLHNAPMGFARFVR